MTLGEWLPQARARLEAAGSTAPGLEAQILAGHALLRDRAWILAHPESEIPDLALEVLLQRMERHEPLAYITGHREFFGLDFRVSPAVLIPRQETEVLVEAVLAFAPPRARVIDAGTGSGCIAISLKSTRPDLRVQAIDVSAAALEVARSNAKDLGADVEFIEGDALLMDLDADIIVSNPPYIGEGESTGRGVADYEPHLALFSGPTGLEFYRGLAGQVGSADLFVEVGDAQPDAVAGVFGESGLTVQGKFKDLLGIDRVIHARLK